MTKNEALLEKFRLCFFVDGLDEFEQTENATHYTLTKKILEWASKSKGNVKFCVASRELPVFETAFKASQRITIQTFTKGDIETLVRQRLGDNPLFENMMEAHESECRQLMGEIIAEADGVFLWVALVLTQLEDALANGDTITMLQKILREAPKELDPFFRSILDSIQDRYRESAYSVLGIAMRENSILLSTSIRWANYEEFAKLTKEDQERRNAGLIGCSMLFDISDRGKLSDLPTDFPRCDSQEEYDARIKDAKSQLMARCKGLLSYNEDDHVIFTHRSVPEFLQRALSAPDKPYDIDDFLVAERLVWMLLAVFKYQYRSEGGTLYYQGAGGVKEFPLGPNEEDPRWINVVVLSLSFG